MGEIVLRARYALVTLMLIILSINTINAQSIPSNVLFSCPNAPADPSRAYLLALINQTHMEDVYGACALSALTTYNSLNMLSNYTINANLTELGRDFINGNPSLPTVNSSDAILANTTILNVTVPERLCVWYNGPGDKNAHAGACNRGLLKKATPFNVTYPNSTIIILPNTNPGSSSSTFSPDPIVNFSPSINWAGYISVNPLGRPITSVTGAWVVQPALPGKLESVGDQWIGIGNSNGTDMVQVETISCSAFLPPYCTNSSGPSYDLVLQYVNANGNVRTLYNYSLAHLKINAGDKITAALAILTNSSMQNQFVASICDRRCIYIWGNETVSRQAGLWIDERPAYINIPDFGYGYLGLVNFVNATYSYAYLTTNSSVSQIAAPNAEKVFMVQTNGQGQPTDLSDSAIPSNLSLSGGFNISNFRIGSLSSSAHVVTKGNNFAVVLHTPVYPETNVTGAAGGTGIYSYTWYVEPNGSSTYESLASCDNLFYNKPICTITTNSSTPLGKYLVKVSVNALGGPLNETLTTQPVTVSVTAPPEKCNATNGWFYDYHARTQVTNINWTSVFPTNYSYQMPILISPLIRNVSVHAGFARITINRAAGMGNSCRQLYLEGYNGTPNVTTDVGQVNFNVIGCTANTVTLAVSGTTLPGNYFNALDIFYGSPSNASYASGSVTGDWLLLNHQTGDYQFALGSAPMVLHLDNVLNTNSRIELNLRGGGIYPPWIPGIDYNNVSGTYLFKISTYYNNNPYLNLYYHLNSAVPDYTFVINKTLDNPSPPPFGTPAGYMFTGYNVGEVPLYGTYGGSPRYSFFNSTTSVSSNYNINGPEPQYLNLSLQDGLTASLVILNTTKYDYNRNNVALCAP